MKREFLCTVLFLVLTATKTYASNKILLKSGRFTPPEGITTFTKALIEAIIGKAHVLIQLQRIPTIKEVMVSG